MPVGRTGTPPLQPCLLTSSFNHYVMFGCLWEINSIQFKKNSHHTASESQLTISAHNKRSETSYLKAECSGKTRDVMWNLSTSVMRKM